MASPVAIFMEEHQDFVLKLKIKASDGTSQIRRVRLPRIADKSGGISYDELVGLVVTFTFPEDAPGNYSVSLTYFDVDEDTVTIASTDELVDAIEQFAGKKILRISTEVKPKAKHSSSEGPPKPAAAPDGEAGPALHPQVQTVLESFVGILATAVTSLQEGLAAPDGPAGQAAAPVSTTTPKKAPSTDNDEGEVTSRAAPPRDIGEKLNRSPETEEAPPAQAEEAKQEVRPFIHGRHTCDSCLTTPIIGRRYNAQNLPDYDLCENCHKNYQGDEVQFEAVELDRDRAFQERWHRRRERIQCVKQASGNRQCGGRGRRRWGRGPVDRSQNRTTNAEQKEQPKSPPAPREDQPPVQPPAPMCPPPPMNHHLSPGFFAGPPPPGPPPHWANLGPHAAPHIGPHLGPHMGPHHHPGWPHPPAFAPRIPQPARPSGDFDDALKEAIRRSLSDIAPKEVEIALGSSSVVPSVDEVSSQDPAKESDAVGPPSVETVSGDIETPDTNQQAVEDLSSNEPAEEACSDPETEQPAAVKVLSHPVSEELKEDAQVEKQDLDRTEEKQDILKKDIHPQEEEQDPQPAQPEVEEQHEETKDESNDVASTGPENATADEKDAPLPSAPSTPKSSTGSKDESFASDAVGSGDVAEAMGATLDMVAGVISEMLFEADAHNRPPTDGEAGTPGELIVDSDQTKSESVAREEESDWQLVKPDENEEASPDDEIGRAAEMLGSALFNSDMQSSAENVSTLSASDSFSVPSTVPSISSGPRVAPAQRAQWSAQLATLNELGFEEALCIETLERLKAANIGVGSNDEITVTQVVDAIMGQN
eukprot:CAMPEP_0117008176 /NCGR_PEP_ID=MMETSP0472-20121206/7785_1 /TAXON_ID=693140 ORGANISM="Tiarina fusus, Strain LIS" /NCGR_SAMPLE_ID=MMETSP0472 /ASSEMBLY_ACC=CAM_ASM_000603 /LENGTH=819 /DNA_ID=CAMNT_0004710141 /DNA_START=113 /DNA_END=2572 /DNA_ORIENTATION=+